MALSYACYHRSNWRYSVSCYAKYDQIVDIGLRIKTVHTILTHELIITLEKTDSYRDGQASGLKEL